MSTLIAFVFAFSMFGLWSAFRITEKMSEKRLINAKMRFEIRVGMLIWISLTVFFCSRSPFLMWSSIFSGVSCVALSEILIRRQRETKFKSEFLEFLERSVLLVRTGKPFRQSLSAANQDNEAFTQQRIDKILEYVFFSPHSEHRESDEFSVEVIKELIAIDRSSHRCLERMVLLKRNLRLESDFRRKSDQVLRRTRWQSYIFTGLYLALLIFMLSTFSFREIYSYVLSSVTFFVAGLMWIILAGRKIKWNI